MTTELDTLTVEAASQGASDVHLDLDADALRLRLRIDGQLRGWVPARLQPDRLRAAAWAMVDSGADRLNDWRVATHADGGRLALRLRAERGDATVDLLTGLGLLPAQARLLLGAQARPGGVIVVAGAPGSGRRSTVASLASGDARLGSVVSIGLPIGSAILLSDQKGEPEERRFERAMALDPDVVILADLSDRAVAACAFQVAAAGRRVIARIDAADAVGAIERLRALRIDRLALAGQLRAVTAQRLASRLCAECRRPVQASNAVAALLGFDPGVVIYESMGCAACEGRGDAGAVGVFEVVALDPAIARLVNDGADAALLTRHAFLNVPRLDSAARAMVRDGQIGAAEAIRLSRAGG